MATLTISGTIAFPLANEASPPSRSFTASLVYTEKVTKDLVITGAQSDVSLLDGIADAKVAWVECVSGTGTIKDNGAATGVVIKAGTGWYSWFNPDGGLTALTVTTTADATFRIYAFA